MVCKEVRNEKDIYILRCGRFYSRFIGEFNNTLKFMKKGKIIFYVTMFFIILLIATRTILFETFDHKDNKFFMICFSVKVLLEYITHVFADVEMQR